MLFFCGLLFHVRKCLSHHFVSLPHRVVSSTYRNLSEVNHAIKEFISDSLIHCQAESLCRNAVVDGQIGAVLLSIFSERIKKHFTIKKSYVIIPDDYVAWVKCGISSR